MLADADLTCRCRRFPPIAYLVWKTTRNHVDGSCGTTEGIIMKIINSIAAALVCASVILSLSVFAQGRPGNDRQGDGFRQEQGHRRENPGYGHQGGPAGHDQGLARGERDSGPRGWHKGERLPNEYRNRQYVINDWRSYGLRRPPRGYHWVGIGGDYVLVAIGSGLIFEIQIGR